MKFGELEESRSTQLPIVIQPISNLAEARSQRVLGSWVSKNRTIVEERLVRHGAILFRGFALATAEDFSGFASIVEPSLRSYVGGDSPREKVSKRIYTSTSHPADEEIPLHNELSYIRDYPKKIFFFCALACEEGGETPIADCRRVHQRISEGVRERFARRRVIYVQNLHGSRGLGKSWQETFETTERAEVEEFLRGNAIEFEWKADGGLRTRSICDGVVRHPTTGEPAWFNQAVAWHLDPETRQRLLAIVREDDLPHNALFGDGERIPDGDLEEVRAAFRAEEIAFRWQRGDVLVLDNLLVAHGRRPFRGARKILVAMA